MGALRVEEMGREIARLDTETRETMIQAANSIEAIDKRHGLKSPTLKKLDTVAEKVAQNSYEERIWRLSV